MQIATKTVLTKEVILKHVSQYDILYRLWPAGKQLLLDRGIESPFRADPTPSFLIGLDEYNEVRYKDLGDSNYKGNSVWKFVQQLYGYKGLEDVLIAIDKAFNLGYSTGNAIVGRPEIITWKEPIVEPKKPTLLQVTVRKYTKEELRWWNEWHIDIGDLKEDEIYAPKEIYRNRKKLPIEIMTFCYYLPDIGKWKIYRPMAAKRNKDTPPHLWKWDNSIGRLDYIDGLQKLQNAPIGIVGKARKDAIVLRKATGIKAICSIQAEDVSAMSTADLDWIDSNVERKIVASDNDKKGKQFSWALTKERGYKHCNVPDPCMALGMTDWADYGKGYGLDAVTKYWQNKGIIK